MKRKITKKAVRAILNDPFYKLEKNIDKKFEELKELFRSYKDEILNKMDQTMGELENHRIEQGGIKMDLKDHEKRIIKLEYSSKST